MRFRNFGVGGKQITKAEKLRREYINEKKAGGELVEGEKTAGEV